MHQNKHYDPFSLPLVLSYPSRLTGYLMPSLALMALASDRLIVCSRLPRSSRNFMSRSLCRASSISRLKPSISYYAIGAAEGGVPKDADWRALLTPEMRMTEILQTV